MDMMEILESQGINPEKNCCFYTIVRNLGPFGRRSDDARI
jgi:hypothetical protein